MKNTRFLELMGGIDEELLERARTPKKKKYTKQIWISALAACLAICIAIGAMFGGTDTPAETITKNGFNIAQAFLPMEVDEAPFYKYYDENGGMAAFYKASIAEMLKTEAGENTVYSPVNVYMELAMLAEMTDGESREQILALLGAENIEEVRDMANALWSLSYNAGESGTTLLANSLWLSDRYDADINPETVKNLAKLYHAGTYSGSFTDPAYITRMKDWTNQQTMGFLKDMEMDWHLTDDTVLSLISTIYFKDRWEYTFSEKETKELTFYLGEEEYIRCEFLCEDDAMVTGYWGENFIAVQKSFKNGGSMLFVLPDWGYTPSDLLEDAEFLRFIASPGDWENVSHESRDIRIPKFDVAKESDITENLKNLGVTDIFINGTANFTPIVKNHYLYVNEIQHGCRVRIDEEGCEGAGYVYGGLVENGGLPKLIKIDRPFIFTVLTEEEIPIFTGVINNPLNN